MQPRPIFMETGAITYWVSLTIWASGEFTVKVNVAHSSVHFHSWSGSHIKWGQSFRIRHITTGRYLFLDEDKGLLLVDAEKANSKMSAFCFRISKVNGMSHLLCQNLNYFFSSLAIIKVSIFNTYRRRLKWPRSVTWKAWALLRSNMESLCALCSMFHLGYGWRMLPWMRNLPVWVLSKERYSSKSTSKSYNFILKLLFNCRLYFIKRDIWMMH